jgi:hypothetical protein
VFRVGVFRNFMNSVFRQLLKSPKPLVEFLKRQVSASSTVQKLNFVKISMDKPKIIFVLGAPGELVKGQFCCKLLTSRQSIQVLAKAHNARRSSIHSDSLIFRLAICCARSVPVLDLSLVHSSRTTSLTAKSYPSRSRVVC